MADDIRKTHWSIRPPVFVIAVVMFIICQNNFEFGFGMVEIASKVELSGECLDYNSNIMADLDVTQSSLGACDARICHKKTSGNYFVDLICHPDTPPLDNGNCQEVSNSGLAFPNCCPTVTCATAAVPTTPDPSVCADTHTSRSCEIWSNLTNHCTDFSVYSIQNYTDVYCQKTCGICSSGSG